ncbi:MAG TPA: pitrilysin family protein [Polyangia bacterium]
MKTVLVLALALACAAPGLALAQGRKPAKAVTPPMTITRLPTGLTVVTVPAPAPGIVAYYTLMRVGSRNEVEPGHSGFAHLFEHMMFFGTPTWPRVKWEAALKERGLDSSGFTSSDMTVFHLTGPTAALPFVIETEADRFQNLTYDEAGFKTETKAVLGEYNKNFANPVRKLAEVLYDKAFDVHTYKHTTMGFVADIQAMPGYYAYSKDFFQRFYRPDNAVIFVVGDFDPKATLALVKRHYGAWKGKGAGTKVPVEPPQTAPRTAHIDWATPTMPRLYAGYHTPAATLKTKDAAIQNVLGPLLFGPQSPLYRDLVLTRQLCYDVSADYDDHRDAHLFGYLATCKDPKDLPEVQRTVDAALAELAAGTLDPKRLADVQSNLRYSLMMQLETPGAIALMLAVNTAPTGDPKALDRLLAQIGTVTVKDVAAFARKYLVAQNRTVVTLTGVAAKAARPVAGGAK